MANKQYKSTKGLYDTNFNKFVYQAIPRQSICLDVGCWTGNLGSKLISKKSCLVDGLDMEKKQLRIAKKYGYRKTFKINLNCNPSDISKIKNKYDIIICGDILEHLAKPKEVLMLLKNLLKKKGQIIISVPNIAFVLYRFLLLLGKFDYNPNGGIMDETHLRMFTQKSIEHLCISAGYKIQSSCGYNQVKNKFFFLRPLAKLFPGLFSLQFLLIITL